MRRRAGITALLLAVILLQGCWQTGERPAAPGGEVTLTFITIGKGDAFLLSAPTGERYLIDTGKRSDLPQIGRLLRCKGVETLDGIFLSHGHLDHAGNLEPLLDAFSVKTVYLSAADTVSYREIDAAAAAEKRGVAVEKLTTGDVLRLGGLTVRCWTPEQADTGKENNNSLVLRVTYGNTAFLLMGDAEAEEEALLLQSGEDLSADVLKLGHHGENDATSPALLRQVRPTIALITGSQAENPDSLDPRVGERLAAAGARPIYGECSGLGIDIRTDGETLSVEVVEDPPLPAQMSLSLHRTGRRDMRAAVVNTGSAPADLGGCTLLTRRSDKVFYFPEGTALAPGESLTVACRNGWQAGDLLWDEEEVWGKKGETTWLYDRNFTLLDECTD